VDIVYTIHVVMVHVGFQISAIPIIPATFCLPSFTARWCHSISSVRLSVCNV